MVRVSVSYMMTIWRWEEFSRCDKFPTTPVALDRASSASATVCLENSLSFVGN